ncbi:unnamed protein product, partial [Ixodes hexagonus]
MSLVKCAFFVQVLLLVYMSPAIASSNCTPTSSNDGWKFLELFKNGYILYITKDIGKICITFAQTQADATTKDAAYNVSSVNTTNQSRSTEVQSFQVQECSTDIEISLQSS